MIRLFVAVDAPAALRRRAASLGRGIDRAKWVAEENMHITLRFIGETPEDRAEDFAEALDRVRAAPLELALSGAGHFGSGRRVRALWLGVEKSEALVALRDRIDSALVRAGCAPEGRKFHPHLTLARFNNGTPGEIHSWLAANTLFRSVPFMVDRFTLYSSHLGRAGAIYTAEAEYELRGG